MKKVLFKKCMMLCVMILMMAAYCVNITACKEAHVNHSASAIETNDTDFADKDFTVNGINYSINDDNKTVTVGKNKHVNGILSIPATVTYNEKTYSVTMIEEYAFFDCSGLTQVTIPESVNEIGNGAFGGCSGLTSISVAIDNPNYDSRNNCNAIIKTKSNTLIAGCKNTIIPNSVTKIGFGAFRGCSGLTQVTIPNSVAKIGTGAFGGCSGLTQVTIPSSVTKIGTGAFSGCSGLTSISVAIDNPNYDSRNNCNAIIKTKSNTLIAGCKNTIIPNSVTEIGKDAFVGCSGLTQVTIPNSVTKIGSFAFEDCSGLTQVTIPNSVTEIENSAFEDCSGLIQVTIPNSVTKIGESAFFDCSGLTKVTAPKWLADNKNEMKRVFGDFKGTVKVNSDSNE